MIIHTDKPITHPFDELDLKYESIGTQMEKPMHQSVKYYLCPDSACHEFKIGKFIADIYQDGHIIEIQTGSFQSMDHKLSSLLPQYKITIVYPVVRRKSIYEMDTLYGTKKPKKSPKIGNILHIMTELVKIKKHLLHPNLDFLIFYVDADEYRIKIEDRTSRKTHERLAQYPKGIPSLYTLKDKFDYLDLLPDDLELEVTAKTLQKALKLNKSETQSLIQIYKTLGLLYFIRKEGRAFVYQLVKKENN
ncbi:MAG: hypothetical protein CVV56_06900 [Tenericutes bacterium HGW-Tenericutes-1]|jgi:hypothetical protein|nr:MAG: hypothetical protein CVV56_06900 [Tenericutes bacterium HGW-Tenericutes-1]